VSVKWQDLPAFETSWQSSRDNNKNFPHLHLEDKVNVYGGVLVGSSPIKSPLGSPNKHRSFTRGEEIGMSVTDYTRVGGDLSVREFS